MSAKRERRLYRDGPIVKMAEADNYVMVRRPGALPFVLFHTEWNALPPAPPPPKEQTASRTLSPMSEDDAGRT